MKRSNLLSWVFIASATVLTGRAAFSQSTLPPVLTDPADIERARVSCDAGNLADCYLYGRSIRPKGRDVKSMKPSFDVSEKACDKGYALACNDKARRYILGINVKIDLKKGRKAAVQGCEGGDTLSCELVKRLDNPPPSAVALRNFPAAEQMNVNHALYFDDIGAERLEDYAYEEPYKSKPEWKWNLMAASCEMGHFSACTQAGLAFMDQPAFKNEYKKDMPRALQLLRIGCNGDDPFSCYSLGIGLKTQTGSFGQESTAAFVKSRPALQKGCDEGKGEYCGLLGFMYQYDIGADYQPDQVDAIYARGCDLGAQRSCDDLAAFREKRAIADAPRLEREKWANGAQSKQYCDGLVSQWNAEAASTQADYAALDARRAKTQTANGANNVFAEMTTVKRQGCYALLAITKQGKYTCPSHYEDMLHTGRKIHYGLDDCAVQLREMDAEYHRTFG